MCLLYLTFYYKLLFASIALLALGCSVVGPQQIINPNYAIHFSAFTINNGRTNVRQWLCQAYSPPPRYDTFFPNASHWAELSRPFKAVFQLLMVIFQIHGSACSTNNHWPLSERAESPNYFSPIPQGWGIDIRTLFGGLKAWMKLILISSIA